MIRMMRRTIFLGWITALLFVWLLQATAVDAKYRDAINFEDNEFVGMNSIELLHRIQSLEDGAPILSDRTELQYEISYGILQNYEIGLNVPVVFNEDASNDVGDVGIVQRFKFSEKETFYIDSSGGLEFILPTGSNSSDPPTGTDDLDFRIFGTIGNQFRPDWHWLVNAGYTLVGDDDVDDEFTYNTSIRYHLIDEIKAIAEINGKSGGLADETQVSFSPGLIAQPRQGLSLHFSLPVGINSEAPDHSALVELAVEF